MVAAQAIRVRTGTTARMPMQAIPPKRRRWRWLIFASVAALLVWLAWEVSHVLLAGNVHEVIPGKLYRGAQPSGSSLEVLIRKYHIRTVLNVRGCCWPDD